MNALLILIPLSVLLLLAAIWAFAWAVRRGQFDDLDTPAIDILAEDSKDRDLKSTAEARARTEREQP